MKTVAFLIGALGFGACTGDDAIDPGDDTPPTVRDFTLRIENVAPWTVLKAGIQAEKTNGLTGPAGPGEAFEVQFTARKTHHVSFATMFGESNDWFFAPDAEGIPLFDENGPTSGDVTRYVKLWNAGTEIDQEPAVGPATAPQQPSPNFGAADPDPDVRLIPATIRLTDGSMFDRPSTNQMIRVTLTPGPDQQFTLRIENVSSPTTLMTSEGGMPIHLSPLAWTMHITPGPIISGEAAPPRDGLEMLAEDGMPDTLGASLVNAAGFHTPLSPGVVIVHDGDGPLFTPGAPDAGAGLERIAEDGNPMPLRDALAANPPAGTRMSAGFDTAVGAPGPGPAMPGQAFEIAVRGAPGDAVSFATMFGMSNDWFFASTADGIPLFESNVARSGDVTAGVVLYDLGSEVDQEIDIGPDTAPQQVAPDTGAVDAVDVVREVTTDRYAIPEATHLRVTLTPR